ncbi:MAG TPA: hypothetical protein VMT46_03475 [Anaerolineaceae bacterium]|nr:hypothetical protein [Anaerolineaceae bacterium]
MQNESPVKQIVSQKHIRINVLTLFGMVYLGMISSALYFIYRNYAYDDPFITYRYSFNLSHGLGFVYNIGQKTLSTTTPLFTLTLAALSFFWRNIPHVANLIGAISIAAGALCLYDLSRSWKTPWVGWVSLLLYPTLPLMTNTIGSETPLYLAFILGAFAAYARKHFSITAVCIGLATLTRPDGILVAIVLGLAYILQHHGQILWKPALILAGMLMIWYGFAWFYFGSPLPVTLMVKHQQGLMTISQKFAPGLFTILGWYFKNWPYWLLAFLGLIGLIRAFWRRSSFRMILLWTGVYFLSYSILGITRYFWYYAPLVPGFIIAVGSGLEELIAWISLRWPKLKKGPVLAVLVLGGFSIWQFSQIWKSAQTSDPRYPVYAKTGIWLNENTPPGAKIGALEVGIIGYYAQRTMIDFAGLIQPEIAAQFKEKTTYEDAMLWAVQHYNPDYLVLQDSLFNNFQEKFVSANCRKIKIIEDETRRYPNDIIIYQCYTNF